MTATIRTPTERAAEDCLIRLADDGGFSYQEAAVTVVEEINDAIHNLLRQVQHHVEDQPWGYNGNAPAPVTIGFDSWTSGRGHNPYRVKFVLGLRAGGRQRRWGWAEGVSLEAALLDARRQQLEAS